MGCIELPEDFELEGCGKEFTDNSEYGMDNQFIYRNGFKYAKITSRKDGVIQGMILSDKPEVKRPITIFLNTD